MWNFMNEIYSGRFVPEFSISMKSWHYFKIIYMKLEKAKLAENYTWTWNGRLKDLIKAVQSKVLNEWMSL